LSHFIYRSVLKKTLEKNSFLIYYKVYQKLAENHGRKPVALKIFDSIQRLQLKLLPEDRFESFSKVFDMRSDKS
jgi:hypothetical protein